MCAQEAFLSLQGTHTSLKVNLIFIGSGSGSGPVATVLLQQYCCNSTVATVLLQQYCCNSIVARVLLQQYCMYNTVYFNIKSNPVMKLHFLCEII